MFYYRATTLLCLLFQCVAWAQVDRAEVQVVTANPSPVSPGGRIDFRVRVRNTGVNSWRPIAPSYTDGAYFLNADIIDPSDTRDYQSSAVISLPREMNPGDSVELSGSVLAPSRAGSYALTFPMLRAGVHRFASTTLNSVSHELSLAAKFSFTVGTGSGSGGGGGGMTVVAPGSAEATPYVVRTIAGSYPIGDGGLATDALLMMPGAVAADDKGNLFILEYRSGLIRMIDPSGKISTVARLHNAVDLAVSTSGKLHVATSTQIFRLDGPDQFTLIGGRTNGGFTGDGGPATQATMFISQIAFAPDGSIVFNVPYSVSCAIRKISPTGIITTIAGGRADGYSPDGSVAATSSISAYGGVAVDARGLVYFSEPFAGRVRRIEADGKLSTVAGPVQAGTAVAPAARPQIGATAKGSTIGFPANLMIDKTGDVLFTEPYEHAVFRVDSGGRLREVAGPPVFGSLGLGSFQFSNGSPKVSRVFNTPQDIAETAQGDYLIADGYNNAVVSVSTTGAIKKVAGREHFQGDGGPASAALFNSPMAAIAAPGGAIYVSDTLNHRVRRIDPSGNVVTVAGTGRPGTGAEGTAADKTDLFLPGALALDSTGQLLIADTGNLRILRVRPDGTVSIVVGISSSSSPTASNLLSVKSIAGLAADSSGGLYFSDDLDHRVYRISSTGSVSLIAGTGTYGSTGDGGAAATARLGYPGALAVDSVGQLYIADYACSCVRKVTPSGIISRVAGNPNVNANNSAKAEELFVGQVLGITVGPDSELHIGALDYRTSKGLEVYTAGRAGGIMKVAGGSPYAFLSPPDSVLATQTEFQPYYVITDPSSLLSLTPEGDLLVADTGNHRIRKLIRNTPAKLELSSGDAQSAPVGSAVSQPLKVRVLGRAEYPASGVTVSFAVSSGQATLSAASTVTGPDGVAGVSVQLGSQPGPVTITATAGSLPPVTFTVTATGSGGPGGSASGAPQISAGGIVGAGLSTPPVTALSPNAIASIFGVNFAPAGTVLSATAADIVNGSVTTLLGGVCVEVGGVRAPLLLLTPGQINFIVPGVDGQTAAVSVIRQCGQAGEARSAPQQVTLAAATPEFFYFTRTSAGNPIAAVNAVTNAFIGPAGLIAGVEFSPAKPGETVTLYGTGFGAVTPPLAPGQIGTAAASVAAPVALTLGGAPIGAGDILYIGITPGLAGVYQLSFRIPADIPDGTHELTLQVGEARSPAGATLSTRR